MSDFRIYPPVLCGLTNLTAAYIVELARVASEIYDIDEKEILTICGLSTEQIQSGEHVPVFYAFSLLLHLIQTTEDEFIGLNLGRHIELKAFHMLGYSLMNCTNVEEALNRVLRYESLALEGSLTEFRQEYDDVIVSWSCPYPGEEARYFRELVISGWASIAKRTVPGGFPLKEVRFTHPAPSNLDLYHQIFECPIVFNALESAMIFSKDLLHCTFQTTDPALGKVMTHYADLMLNELDDHIGFLSELRRLIYKIMPNGEVTIDRVAETMEISPRALHLRLKKLNISFTELLDDVRRILALVYLEDRNITQLDIAVLLGYSDQSAFCRAFKRWVGETPGDYRKSVMMGEGLYRDHLKAMLHTE
ncbi:MAG: AraC family transcriptional regulator [Pseudomonadota bacterium]